MKLVESGSSLGCFRTCPKKYQFSYRDRLSASKYSQSLGFGNFVHLHRAIYHGSKIGQRVRMEEELTQFRDEMLRIYQDATGQIAADERLAASVVAEWVKYWEGVQSSLGESMLEWKDVEKEWAFLVGSNSMADYVHVGKRDGLVRHKDWDKTFLYELKTASDRGGESYRSRLQLDYQINSNLMALKKAEIPVAGVLYDIIWKPALRRKVDRKTAPDETEEEFSARILQEYRDNPSQYFERLTVSRTDAHLAEYEVELLHQFDAVTSERTYRNPNACMNYNQPCQFFDLCMDPAAQEQRSYFIQRNRKHPELSEEIQ